MEISEVRVKLIGNPTDRLKAFASVTLDGDFVVRDIKVIDGTDGVFVAMPSRKLADRCPKCKCKNHLRAKYCNECGAALRKGRVPRDKMGRSKLHADIAHPINSDCRRRLQEQIVEAYKIESERAAQPGYKPPDQEDELDYEDIESCDEPVADTRDADEHGTGNESGYDGLIAELKRDAAERRDARARPAPTDRGTTAAGPARGSAPCADDADRAAARSADEPRPPDRETVSRNNADEADDFGAGIL